MATERKTRKEKQLDKYASNHKDEQGLLGEVFGENTYNDTPPVPLPRGFETFLNEEEKNERKSAIPQILNSLLPEEDESQEPLQTYTPMLKGVEKPTKEQMGVATTFKSNDRKKEESEQPVKAEKEAQKEKTPMEKLREEMSNSSYTPIKDLAEEKEHKSQMSRVERKKNGYKPQRKNRRFADELPQTPEYHKAQPHIGIKQPILAPPIIEPVNMGGIAPQDVLNGIKNTNENKQVDLINEAQVKTEENAKTEEKQGTEEEKGKISNEDSVQPVNKTVQKKDETSNTTEELGLSFTKDYPDYKDKVFEHKYTMSDAFKDNKMYLGVMASSVFGTVGLYYLIKLLENTM